MPFQGCALHCRAARPAQSVRHVGTVASCCAYAALHSLPFALLRRAVQAVAVGWQFRVHRRAWCCCRMVPPVGQLGAGPLPAVAAIW
jgi:hypothetical protein